MKRAFLLTATLAFGITAIGNYFAAANEVESIKLSTPNCNTPIKIQKPELQAGEKCPVVIICHGLTGHKDEAQLTSLADSLLAHGIASVRFDFNGHGESDTPFSQHTISKELDDLQAVFEYVRGLDWVDASRIALSGHSQGGVVAGMKAGQLGADSIRCLALLAPAACIHTGAVNGNFFGRDVSNIDEMPDSIPFWGGRFLGKAYLKDAVSLDIHGTTALYKGPSCIVQGDKDDPALIKDSEKYTEYMPLLEFYTVEGFDHCYTQDPGKALEPAVRFLVGNLTTRAKVHTGAAKLPGMPMPTAFRTDRYPRLMADNSVLFRIEAKQAKKVTLILPILGEFPMNNDNGVWTVRTAPLQEGFHYYWFNIDGAEVNDPLVKVYHGYGRECSAIEIPVPDSEWMEPQDVPHGRVSEMYYWSDVVLKWRKICVYTPAEYDRKPLKRYPVMYIGHGSGEDNRGWMEQGRTGTILDNLIAQGKATPMIAVSMDSQLYDELAPYNREGMQPYAKELLGSIIPFVDRTFRTKADAGHRAICGLSQGSGEAFYIGMTHPELFSRIGMFSCGLFGAMKRQGLDFDKEIPGLLSNAEKFNRDFPVIYFSCGTEDYRIDDYDSLAAELEKAGLEFTYEKFQGYHEWQPWRESVRSFAQMIF